ncbi:Thaumatin domain-containing protein [Cephalotus follicularis]|uniref:Thaumatin domain-containing protein n=1 Tax=Cephalotus follicularis TaxID=3775 RepID=A0A1Q3AZG1_CEPFO|nr:Thaumatin domain-containing protein [Cephalotus follicularis]
MGHNYGSPLTILFTFLMASGSYMFARAKTFTIVNDCKETVWPGIITHSDNFSGGGFALKPGQSAVYNAPAGWSGRIWARTGCNFSHDTGTGTCQTGSCGTQLNCTGPSSPPNTIAEITVGGDTDFYDVSLVNGFNLPIYILPLKGKGNCSIAGCDGDLRQSCPSQLAVKENGTVIACKSACDEFDTDEYCCRGSYADPAVCKPTNYSMSFKQVCPAASSYALDDRSTIIACSGSEYIVAFCASR